MACVDLPAFPLQILLKRHPDWRGLPAAVVDEDRPQGMLLWVNERARAGRVLSGMRYAAALSLARELHAGVVPPPEIAEEIETLMKRLRFFSPEVEPARDDPGTFWLGADGLGLLHPSFREWAALIRADLVQAGYSGSVAVGFSRFGTYAAARAAGGGRIDESAAGASRMAAGRGVVVFGDAGEERSAVRRIPIDRIACDPEFRDTLARLGIFELGGFLDLPPSGVRKRFGEEAYALHRRARGESWTPLTPEIPEEPHQRRIVFDAPESDTGRLLQAIDQELRPLLARLRGRDRALCGLIFEIGFDRPAPDGARWRTESLRPAAPTRDPELLSDLLRLRLESMRLPSGVVEVRVEVEWCAAGAEQLTLFAEPHRDLEAANRALARVRAEFGEDSVCSAVLRDAHLPEARFALEPLPRLAAAHPRAVRTPPLIRRHLFRAEAITLRRRSSAAEGARTGTVELTGMTIQGAGVIGEATGPYVVSGGWWKQSVTRLYWYVRIEPEAPAPPGRALTEARGGSPGNTGKEESGTKDPAGSWHWIYHDARRRRWFRQGEVD